MQSIDAMGLWHLPSAPADRVAGKLTFSAKDGFRLSLIGSLTAGPPRFTHVSYPVIHGILTAHPFGRFVTLQGCNQIAHSIGMPGLSTETIRPRIGYFGAQLLESTEPVFDEVRVRYTHLSDWSGPSRFVRSALERISDEGRISISYDRPDSLKLKVDNDTVDLCQVIAFESTAHEVSLQERASFAVMKSERLSTSDFVSSIVVPLQNLLTLATEAPNGIESLEFVRRDLTFAGTTHPAPFTVLFQPIFSSDVSVRPLHDHRMLFSLEDIRGMEQGVLQRWMSFSKEFRSFCEVYFSERYAPSHFIDIRFLMAIEAASLFFACDGSTDGPASAALRDVQARLLSAVPGQLLREWTERLLPRPVEIDLPWHLQRVMQKHGSVMSPLISESFDQFIGRVVAAKTAIGQRRRPEGSEPSRGHVLLWIMDRLDVLLKASILGYLEFPSDRIVELFNRNARYQYLKETARPPV